MVTQGSASRPPFDEVATRAIIAAKAGLDGALLPILHDLQEAFGYIDPAVVPILAEALNLSRAEVHGVISFYHDFRDAPAGRHILKICRAESCQAMGVDSLIGHLGSVHRLFPGETTADGQLTIEDVYCLGQCAISPAVMLDGEPIGHVDEARLDELVLETTGARA